MITFENGQAREQLGSLRDIATVYKSQENLEQAVELLAAVLHHPAREQNSLSRWESLKTEAEGLLEEMKAELSTERFDGVWQRGKTLELGTLQPFRSYGAWRNGAETSSINMSRRWR